MKLHFEPNLGKPDAGHRGRVRLVPGSGGLPYRVHGDFEAVYAHKLFEKKEITGYPTQPSRFSSPTGCRRVTPQIMAGLTDGEVARRPRRRRAGEAARG